MDIPPDVIARALDPAVVEEAVPPPGQRMAAVLVVLYDGAAGRELLLTERPQHLSRHPGQISLPGGVVEPQDAGPLAAALRETHEEIDIHPSRLTVLGRLTEIGTRVSNSFVFPFVASHAGPPALRPNPSEVERVISVPLATVLDPGSVAREEWQLRGHPCLVTFFRLEGVEVWGLTARILADLGGRLGTRYPWPPGAVEIQ